MEEKDYKAELERLNQERLRACAQEMQALLVRYGVDLVAVASVDADGRIVATVQLRGKL